MSETAFCASAKAAQQDLVEISEEEYILWEFRQASNGCAADSPPNEVDSRHQLL